MIPIGDFLFGADAALFAGILAQEMDGDVTYGGKIGVLPEQQVLQCELAANGTKLFSNKNSDYEAEQHQAARKEIGIRSGRWDKRNLPCEPASGGHA